MAIISSESVGTDTATAMERRKREEKEGNGERGRRSGDNITEHTEHLFVLLYFDYDVHVFEFCNVVWCSFIVVVHSLIHVILVYVAQST